jgi:hypothetical protein
MNERFKTSRKVLRWEIFKRREKDPDNPLNKLSDQVIIALIETEKYGIDHSDWERFWDLTFTNDKGKIVFFGKDPMLAIYDPGYFNPDDVIIFEATREFYSLEEFKEAFLKDAQKMIITIAKIANKTAEEILGFI